MYIKMLLLRLSRQHLTSDLMSHLIVTGEDLRKGHERLQKLSLFVPAGSFYTEHEHLDHMNGRLEAWFHTALNALQVQTLLFPRAVKLMQPQTCECNERTQQAVCRKHGMLLEAW